MAMAPLVDQRRTVTVGGGSHGRKPPAQAALALPGPMDVRTYAAVHCLAALISADVEIEYVRAAELACAHADALVVQLGKAPR
jgi:hypothetical protein